MVTVLRIGHRVQRDKRITSHLALVARAFGASRIIITGEEDNSLVQSIEKIVSEWGGNFHLDLVPYDDWKSILLRWKEEKKKIVHLSMYGENLSDFESTEDFYNLKNQPQNLKNLLVIVGGKKVPGKVFHYADWNIAIGNQPHSEVSSLAVFLDHLIPNALQIQFENAEKRISPSLRGKKKFKIGDDSGN
ncbi:MAG: tRNA (cytidine(56)-2'-O)-methyltransferase [Candidatus Hodarchaeota archaeon]